MKRAVTRGRFQRVEIARKDGLVLVVIDCNDVYAAMQLYDSMAKHLADGYVKIELEPRGAKVERQETDG